MNKIVLFLPVSFMLILFYFGYQYVISGNQVTNEQLINEIIVELESERINNQEVLLKGKWDWTQMPIDGVIGDDYLLLTIQSEDSKPVSSEVYQSYELKLLKGSQVLKEFEGTIIGEGIGFSFPNAVIDHESYGNRGEFEVLVQLESDTFVANLTYLHTWEDHENVLKKGIDFISQELENSWIVRRFLEFQ